MKQFVSEPSRRSERTGSHAKLGTAEPRHATYLLDRWPNENIILLSLSIRIRECDDPNFGIPSTTLTFHL